MIQQQSVYRAIQHLCAFGDTDLFPRLPEMRCFLDCSEKIAQDCSNLNFGQYNPVSAVETLTPKSWLGFRISHQLTAADNLIFLASLLDCAPQLEAARHPKEHNSAFAYRYVEDETFRIFEAGRGYHQWLAHLSEFSGNENPFAEDRPAIATDISDFYQRIYFHRVENVLDDAGCPNGPKELIKKIIKTTRARQSYGLPVGSTASRLIAECVLNDTDNFLQNLGVEFSRYVDDFRIIVPPGMEAHSVLCLLAEHLMVTEGLSLNVSKTKLVSVQDIENSSQSRLQDILSHAEMEKLRAFISFSYGEDEDPKDEDLISNPFLTSKNLMQKIDELGDKKGVDLSVFKALLRTLRFLPEIDAMHLLEKHAELLYFVPREFCLAISAAAKQDGFDQEAAKSRVLALLKMSPYKDLAFVRCWLINLFIDGTLPVHLPDWNGYAFHETVIEKRAYHFLRGLSGDRAHFRALKTQLGTLSEWEKPAVLMAAMCLPLDEYKNWLSVALPQLSSPFAATFVGWLKTKHGSLAAILSEPLLPA